MPNDRIALADAVENLRDQLLQAMEGGKGKSLRFGIEELDLEFKCTVSREGAGKAGVKFWIVEAGAEGKIGNSMTQTVKLKLKPVNVKGNPDEPFLLGG